MSPNPLLALASADALKSTSSGSGTSSQSQSSVATLSLMGGLVAADVVKSNSKATCSGGQASVTGSAEIVGLVAAGQSILVSNPNLAISLPGGISLIVNEQTSSSGGNSGSITVNALHVKGPSHGRFCPVRYHVPVTVFASARLVGADFSPPCSWLLPFRHHCRGQVSEVLEKRHCRPNLVPILPPLPPALQTRLLLTEFLLFSARPLRETSALGVYPDRVGASRRYPFLLRSELSTFNCQLSTSAFQAQLPH